MDTSTGRRIRTRDHRGRLLIGRLKTFPPGGHDDRVIKVTRGDIQSHDNYVLIEIECQEGEDMFVLGLNRAEAHDLAKALISAVESA